MRNGVLSLILILIILVNTPYVLSTTVGVQTQDLGRVVYTTETPTGGVTDFLSLTDTPSSYSGHGGKCVLVDAGETGLEFTNCPSGGGGGNTTEEIQDAVGEGFTGNLSYDDASNLFDINPTNLGAWLDAFYVRLTNIVTLVGNWSADKANYYTKTEVDLQNTSQTNYINNNNDSVNNNINTKLPLAGGTLTGNLNMSASNISMTQGNYICMIQNCSSYILHNGTHLVLQG